MKFEQIECSETSAYKIETPGNYSKENILYSEHGESLKSSILYSNITFKAACTNILTYKICYSENLNSSDQRGDLR